MSTPAEVVQRLIEGFRGTALVAAAVRVGLFEGLSGTPRSCDELAAELNLHLPSVQRVLRGLAVLELVFEKINEADGRVRYGLTAAGELLRSDAANSQACFARLCQQQYVPAWMHMETALRQGMTPFQAAFGDPVWEYRQTHPDEGALFDAWLNGQSATVVDPIVDACDFEGCQRIADIGGGRGILLASVLRRYAAMRGVLADQPTVLSAAESEFRQGNLVERCEFAPADFFVSVPADCDRYLLKSVLHDWNDQDCLRILNRIREAMPVGARLLVIERLLPARAIDDPSTIWLDLHMLCVTGGRERSLAEFQGLLERSGLVLLRTNATTLPFFVLEAVAALPGGGPS
jgi:hypothetical protein